ncbi:MAG: peptidylprolyl isomerase [Gammaproteobacteria bacterium]
MTAPVVKIETNFGDISIELDSESAPKTVANFLSYVEEGFYNGTIFHRVIDGFMIQGGGFDAEMRQKPTKDNVENEANNGLSNSIGTIAMARTPDPHSATAQFFINVADNTFLDHKDQSDQGWGYCVFGRVTDGMDTVNKIKAVPTTVRSHMRDVPEESVEINAVVLSSVE